MRHLKRMAGLLLAIIVLTFIIPRVVPTQALPADLGFYPVSSEENAGVWAAHTLQYADPNTCADCHQDNGVAWRTGEHASVSCENCHGPGERHVENIIPMKVDASSETCTVCHARITGRPASFPQVNPKEHAGEITCVTCHNPHSPQIGGVAK